MTFKVDNQYIYLKIVDFINNSIVGGDMAGPDNSFASYKWLRVSDALAGI